MITAATAIMITLLEEPLEFWLFIAFLLTSLTTLVIEEPHLGQNFEFSFTSAPQLGQYFKSSPPLYIKIFKTR